MFGPPPACPHCHGSSFRLALSRARYRPPAALLVCAFRCRGCGRVRRRLSAAFYQAAARTAAPFRVSRPRRG